MRAFSILSLTMLTCSVSSWALHPASAIDVQIIQKELDRANEIQHRLKDANGDDISIDRLQADYDRLSNSIDPKPARLQELARRIGAQKKDRDDARSKAVRLALAAFDITPTDSMGAPVMPSGVGVCPDFDGKSISWEVLAGDNEERRIQDAKGKWHVVPKAVEKRSGKEPDGLSLPDGTAKIFTRFFETRDSQKRLPSPEALAAILIHEQRHFVQFTTRGEGDSKGFNQLEIDAHKADMGDQFAPSNPLGMRPDEFAFRKEMKQIQVEYYRQELRDEQFKRAVSGGLWSGGVPDYFQPNTNEELAAIKQRARELDQQIRREAEERRTPLGPPAATPPLAPHLPPLAPPPAVSPPGLPPASGPVAEKPIIPVGSNLFSLACAACRAPDALTPDELRSYLVGFPDGRDWGRREAHECSDALYNELMQINVTGGSLTFNQLVDAAWRLKRQYEGGAQPYPDPQPKPSERDHWPINPHPPRPAPNPWRGT